jgi:hypothetical protein
MNNDNMQNLSILPVPQNLNEFNILQAYHNHLMMQINEMGLHPSYIEDIKKVLLDAIRQVVFQEDEMITPKGRGSLFSLFSKKTR